jgi:hypothetical protein
VWWGVRVNWQDVATGINSHCYTFQYAGLMQSPISNNAVLLTHYKFKKRLHSAWPCTKLPLLLLLLSLLLLLLLLQMQPLHPPLYC